MPQYNYICEKCDLLIEEFMSIPEFEDFVASIKCHKCGGEVSRDYSMSGHTTGNYHKPINMLSLAVNPEYQGEMIQRLGPGIDVKDGVPIARNRQQKKHIMKTLGYEEGN